MSEALIKILMVENELLKEKLRKYEGGEEKNEIKFYILKDGEEYKRYGRDSDEELKECIKIFGYSWFEYGTTVIYKYNFLEFKTCERENYLK